MEPDVISLEALKVRYGTRTPRRQFLFERLLVVMQLLRQTGRLSRVYLFGSFITQAPSPNDVDMFVIMTKDFTTAGLSEEHLVVFTHEHCRIRYNIDVFWVTEAIGESSAQSMVEVFSRGRSGQHQGIVEVAR